jgi:hypothetical protein
LQQHLEGVSDIVGMQFGETFGAVPSLEKKGFASTDLGQVTLQAASLSSKDQGRAPSHALQNVLEAFHIWPLGLLQGLLPAPVLGRPREGAGRIFWKLSHEIPFRGESVPNLPDPFRLLSSIGQDWPILDMMKLLLSVCSLGILLSLTTTTALFAQEGWGGWPDLRFLPSNPSGWSLEKLNQHWAPALFHETGEDGAYLVVRQGRPRSLRVGEGVGVYMRSFDGGQQGLVGRGEVVEASHRTGMARVRLSAAHLTRRFTHDPWRGWVSTFSWRPGYRPGEVSYFVSPENLVAMPEAEWKPLLEGRLYRGMSARNLMRTLGSPSARGSYEFSRGRQEQWVYQRSPRARTYVYVDADQLRVTGFHEGL